MKFLLTRLTPFVGRHWLRIALIGCALVLLSQKQVNLNVRLGHPAEGPLPATVPLGPEQGVVEGQPLLMSDGGSVASIGRSLLNRLNLFGSDEAASVVSERLGRVGQRATAVAGFLTRFGHVAQAEQQKYGIPASVILGVGLLYSDAGTTAPAVGANNFFVLPCTNEWSGARTEMNGRCQREYPTAWTSFRDFSTTVTRGKYGKMRQFGARDYRRWAAGLQELGFNDDDRLATDLVAVIERYSLTRYD